MIMNGEPIFNVIEKHFGWNEGNEIYENNIIYINKICREISGKMRKMKGIEDEYVIGEDVIYRKYI